MKYANSLKIMNSFAYTLQESEISQKRTRELCERLGRVHLGMRVICLPAGSAGYACALMLEAVIKDAGHRVGRLTSAWNFDARASIFVDSEIVDIESFVKAASELKSATQKLGEQYYLQEATFALGLLLFRMHDCEYVILQGMSDSEFSLDCLCAPYELIVMPTVYDESEQGMARLRTLCDGVRRGTREVVSGNQKSEIYNQISNSCAMSGVRLYIPVKAQFEVTEVTPRKVIFQYGGREGYSLRSPSIVLRNAAMTVIESALALRRGGVKMPWSSILSGLASVSGIGGFELISMAPHIVSDFASNGQETELLLNTVDELGGNEKPLILCVGGEDADIESLLSVFSDRQVDRILLVGGNAELDERAVRYDSIEAAASAILEHGDEERMTLCLGGVKFASDIRSEIVKQINCM